MFEVMVSFNYRKVFGTKNYMKLRELHSTNFMRLLYETLATLYNPQSISQMSLEELMERFKDIIKSFENGKPIPDHLFIFAPKDCLSACFLGYAKYELNIPFIPLIEQNLLPSQSTSKFS
uniref:Uncharacterized protein n=1 Tax=Euglena viridis TaxID=3040 RepID=M1ETR7_EUGVI|nr:hypothetical protein I642_p063 [Euglena viridis]AEY70782.1 hypothetical protein [Euglena viridis]